MAKQRRRRKRRRGKGARERSGGGGVLTGMRSGFRNAAHTVTGTSKRPGRRRGGVSLVLTAIFVLAAAALVFGRGV